MIFTDPYIGVGTNPNDNFMDIPLGFGMQLYQHADASQFFASLDREKRNGLIRYIEDSKTGEEAKERVSAAVQMMREHRINFYDL